MIKISELLKDRWDPSAINITCIDNGDVEIFDNGVRKIERDVIEKYIGIEPCITTRVVNIFKPVSKKEINILVLVARIASCLSKTRIYLLIDDSTDDTIESAHMVNTLVEKYGIEVTDLIDSDLESTLVQLRRLKKSLEKYRGVSASENEEFEKGSLLLQEISRSLSTIIETWSSKKHVLEALVKLISSKTDSKLESFPYSIIERFYHERIRETMSLLRGLAAELFLINLGSLTQNRAVSMKEALYLFDSYLRGQGCREVVVIDGEDFAVIVKLLGLSWRVIIAS